LVVVWRVTTRCNLSCGFCAYDRRLPFPRVDISLTDFDRFTGLLSQLGSQQGRAVHLSFLGGEPLLWQALAQREAALGAFGLSLGATTNGTRLADPAVRARLLQYYDELTVSLDAASPLHDGLRGWPGGFAALTRALKQLLLERRAAGSALRIRINCVLMRRTLPEFERLCELCAALGIDELTFNQLGGADRPEYYAEQGLDLSDVERLAELLPPLQQRLRRAGVLLRSGPEYLERLRSSAEGRALPVSDCRPGDEFWFIDERGRVGPCSFTLAEYGVNMAELQSVADLVLLPITFRKTRESRRAVPCADCRSTQVFSKWSEPLLAPTRLARNSPTGVRVHVEEVTHGA
jgi:MoaA/NifB/PqqE/SkfB family radical SAM enzyme